jgi:hypothetical protein
MGGLAITGRFSGSAVLRTGHRHSAVLRRTGLSAVGARFYDELDLDTLSRHAACDIRGQRALGDFAQTVGETLTIGWASLLLFGRGLGLLFERPIEGFLHHGAKLRWQAAT